MIALVVSEEGAQSDRARLTADLSEIGFQAERRLAEFSTALHDLVRQVSRR
jgi:hypothetical protein